MKNNFKKIISICCLMTFFLMMIPLGGNVARGATNSSYPSGVIGQFTFDDGTITNTVNSETYTMASGNSISIGWSGKGLVENGGVTSIPLSDLGFTNTSTNATISFWYKWDGSNYIMPICFNTLNVYLCDTLGINTQSNLYGMSSNPFSTNQFVHVTIEFTEHNDQATKIYINGSPQILTQRIGFSNNSLTDITTGYLKIGGMGSYTPKRSIIDNINVWNRSLTDDEVTQVYDNEKTDLTALNSGRVGQFSFNGSTITNSVNSKTYSDSGELYIDAMNDKGLSLQSNKCVTIPETDMGFSSASNYLTCSFWIKWDGVDGEMPLHFSNCDFYITKEYIGLNSSGLYYGITNSFNTQGFYHVVMQLTKGDNSATLLYINGVKQNCSYYYNNNPNKPAFGSNMYFNCPYGIGSYFCKNTIIDEVSIYNRQLSDIEVQKLYNYEKTPLPNLSINTAGNGVKMNWSTEIAPEDTLWTTGFENSNDPFPASFWTNNSDSYTGFNWADPLTGAINQGNQVITSTNPILGNNSYQLTPGNWNHKLTTDPATDSIFCFSRLNIPNKSYLTVQYYAKNSGTSGYINTLGDGGWGASFEYHNVHLTQAAPVGTTILHVDTVENYSSTGGSYWLTSDTNAGTIQNMYQIKAVDSVNKTITLYTPLAAPMSINQQVNSRPWRYAFISGYPSITSVDGIKRFGTNMNTGYCSDYDFSTRGIFLDVEAQTNGILNIDDMKLGYASKAKIYRDGIMIYEGYDSQYTDTNADKTSPNALSTPTVIVKGQNVTISWDPVTDIGETHNYSIQGVSREAGSSVISPARSFTYVSGLAGYAYVVDQNSSTDPGNIVNTTTTSFNKNLAPGVYYMHVKAIDNAGNITTTVHKQFTVLKNTPVITPTANNTANNIKLSWISSDMSQVYNYTISKRLSGTSTFSNLLSGVTFTSYTDTSATDNAAPNTVNNGGISLVYNASAKKIQWAVPSDNGTSYDYQVAAMGQSDGITQASAIATSKIMTGIKGYYVIVDTSPSTIPTSANLITTNSYDVSTLAGGNYYLHLISVDNANNVSSVVHQSFIIPKVTLTAAAETSNKDNYIRLSWSINDISQAYKYDIYRNGSLLTTIALNTIASQSYNDLTGKDTAAPNAVSGLTVNLSGTTASIAFNPASDIGNSFSYYIIATGTNGNVIQSNTVNPSIIKGLAGYSYKTDGVPNTTPQNEVNGVSTTVTQNCIVGTNYFHISAVDNAGNLSTPVHQIILVNPDIKAYINSNDIDGGTTPIIKSTDILKIQVTTNGAKATVKFQFNVRDGRGTTYPANTEIVLEYDSTSSSYTGSYVIEDSLVKNNSIYAVTYKAYSADNTTSASKSGNILVKTLLITGMKITQIVKPVSGFNYPINAPVGTPINIKSGYNVLMDLDVTGQDYADLSFYSNGQPITIYSALKLNQNTIRVTSSNSIIQFIFCVDDLPIDSIIDIKATAYANTGTTVVNNALGTSIFKIVGSAKDDIFIDLIR